MASWAKGKRMALIALVEIVAVVLVMLLAVSIIPRVAPPPSLPVRTVPGDAVRSCPRTLRPCQ